MPQQHARTTSKINRGLFFFSVPLDHVHHNWLHVHWSLIWYSSKRKGRGGYNRAWMEVIIWVLTDMGYYIPIGMQSMASFYWSFYNRAAEAFFFFCLVSFQFLLVMHTVRARDRSTQLFNSFKFGNDLYNFYTNLFIICLCRRHDSGFWFLSM